MKLPPNEIATRLQQLQAWTLHDDPHSIGKAWTFADFDAAVDFFNRVCALAKAHDHHPEMVACYTHVRLRLWTHDAKGLTDKDFRLATDIDQLGVLNHDLSA